jgi:hypothetical protein
MGKFTFENTIKMEFEDRLLAHLQQVMTAKLRRRESFVFSWKEDPSVGGGRTSVWVHPNSVLVFKFHGGRQPAINPAWLLALTFTANGPHGLYVVPEPDELAARRATQEREPMKFRMATGEAPIPAGGTA